jgi:3-oxoacyl-[acyl-carrier-protein] synthase II
VAHKGNFGNLGPSTSTVELIGAIMSLQKRQLPPTLNFDFPDPVCPIDVSPKHVISLESGRRLTVLKSSVSNTGQIASVVLSSS